MIIKEKQTGISRSRIVRSVGMAEGLQSVCTVCVAWVIGEGSFGDGRAHLQVSPLQTGSGTYQWVQCGSPLMKGICQVSFPVQNIWVINPSQPPQVRLP